jgi:hypothetical protein
MVAMSCLLGIVRLLSPVGRCTRSSKAAATRSGVIVLAAEIVPARGLADS